MHDEPRMLDFEHALPEPISGAFQLKVTGLQLKLKGKGSLRIELKSLRDGAGVPAGEHMRHTFVFQQIDSADYTTLTTQFPTQLGPLKFLNVVADAPSDLTIDDLSLVTETQNLDPLRYAFLCAYAQLLRCYDPATGCTRDHGQLPAGQFDCVPIMGGQALAAACAFRLGVIAEKDAVSLAQKSIDALLAIPRHESGLLPHWLERGKRHPCSEISTVDSATALLSAIQAAGILKLSSRLEALRRVVDAIDFAAVTTTGGEISHGFSKDGTLLPNTWREWGGETALVSLLKSYQNPAGTEPVCKHTPPHYNGVGFIIELGALLIPHLGAEGAGSDKWGVNWNTERRRHYNAQQLHRDSPFGVAFSAAEVVAGEEDRLAGMTRYGVFGLAEPKLDGGRMWYTPHYRFMTASLDINGTEKLFDRFRKAGLLSPLSGPAESILINADGTVARWHSAEIALNAWFSVMGAYHAICRRDGLVDDVYQTATTDPRLRAAIGTMFPGQETRFAPPSSVPSGATP
jgi:hypothetical protein